MLFFLLVIFMFFLLFLRRYNKSRFGKYNGDYRLHGKTVIVTGADSGIGLFCAKDFAKRGAKVIMLSCDLDIGMKAKDSVMLESKNSNVKVKYIDFSNLETVRNCANEILKEESHIHILLNNAGVAKIGIYHTTDNLDAVTQINYFGPFLLTNILLEKIKASQPSRIVNVTSIAQKYGKLDLNNLAITNTTNEWLLYSNSKLAVTYFTLELSEKLKGTGVTVNCLHPGVFFSGIVRTLPSFSLFLWKLVTQAFLKTIEEASQTSIYLCTSPDVKHITGKYFEDCKISVLPFFSFDTNTGKKLWNLSKRCVGLK